MKPFLSGPFLNTGALNASEQTDERLECGLFLLYTTQMTSLNLEQTMGGASNLHCRAQKRFFSLEV